MTTTADVVLQAFDAVEHRDREALLALYHPDVEFHDAPSLPYGGTLRGKDKVARFDAPVLGLHEVREGKFGRAQMFHFDTVAVVDYLARATP